MTRVAQQLEAESAAHLAFYAGDVWTEAAYYGDEEAMQTELQAAVLSLENNLSALNLNLSPNETEFLSANAKRLTDHTQILTLSMNDTSVQSKNGYHSILRTSCQQL